jgi:hypothetical protein
MAHGIFPAWQSHGTFVAGGMFAEGYFLCRAVGKGQTEGGLLVNGGSDGTDMRPAEACVDI